MIRWGFRQIQKKLSNLISISQKPCCLSIMSDRVKPKKNVLLTILQQQNNKYYLPLVKLCYWLLMNPLQKSHWSNCDTSIIYKPILRRKKKPAKFGFQKKSETKMKPSVFSSGFRRGFLSASEQSAFCQWLKHQQH